jgi:hypothetical protein
VQYIGANVPQAWAAGAPFVLLQTMLGIVPNAPHGRLYVDPALPDWMPDVTLTDLRLGRKTMDLRFWRDGEETKFEVLRGGASIVMSRPITDALDLKTHRSRRSDRRRSIRMPATYSLVENIGPLPELQGLHSSCGLVRPSASHRYSRLMVGTNCSD